MKLRRRCKHFAPCGAMLVIACLTSICPEQAVAAQRVSVIAGPVHVMRHLTHLVKPSVAPSNRLCTAAEGDAGTVVEAVATEDSPVVWVRVRFASGDCTNAEGWVAAEVLVPE